MIKKQVRFPSNTDILTYAHDKNKLLTTKQQTIDVTRMAAHRFKLLAARCGHRHVSLLFQRHHLHQVPYFDTRIPVARCQTTRMWYEYETVNA